MFYILFSMLLLLLSNQPAMAEERYPDIFQGIISSTEGSPKSIVINERKVLLDNKVEIMDHKENRKSLSDLAAGKWIYVISEKRPPGTTAMRIYFIPKRVSEKEKFKYPFMKREEDPEE